MEKLPVVLVLFYASLVMTTVSGKFEGNHEVDQWVDMFTQGQLKVTRFRFYVQHVVAGPNSTVVTVAQGPESNKLPTSFGTINVFDHTVTEGPEPTSNSIGRAQGIGTFSGKDEIAFLLVFNFVFTSGEFNGSSLAVLGRNAPFRLVREMPIVGGTGLFRLARGFVTTKTYDYDATTINGVYEYDVVAVHY